MAYKITELTAAQKAKFPAWVKKWIEVGLSTEPADFDKATDAALRAYKLCNLKRPMVILRMGSPYGATVGGALAWLFLREASRASGSPFAVRDQVGDQVWAQVGDQVWDQVGAQVRDQVWAQVVDQVREQVRDQVRDQVWDQVGDQVGDQVWAQVRAQVGDQVLAQVRDQVWDQVWAQVRDQVRDQVGDQVLDQVWAQVWAQVKIDGGPLARAAQEGANNYSQGAFWANWTAYVSFMRDVLDWQDPILEKAQVSEDLTLSCGWIWWHENICAISDRPSELHRDWQGRLHNESGPSIAYRDGWKLYHWHGVSVPLQVIEFPETITAKQIQDEKNAEVQRIMIERVGAGKYLRESGAKLIDMDSLTLEGSAPRALMEDKTGNRWLTGTDGSTARVYTMAVPREAQTCAEAHRMISGLDKESRLIAEA